MQNMFYWLLRAFKIIFIGIAWHLDVLSDFNKLGTAVI